MTAQAITAVTFEVIHTISSSKGWGRYRAAMANGAKLVESSTGNEWVSAAHGGDAEEGSIITARLQTMERVGKMRKERIDNYDYRLVAKAGATCELGFWDGLQVRVTGAEVAA